MAEVAAMGVGGFGLGWGLWRSFGKCVRVIYRWVIC